MAIFGKTFSLGLMFGCLAVGVSSLHVSAQGGRPSRTSLTCAQAKSMVDKRGAVVMTTGGGKFERFVSGTRYCPMGATTKPTYARTKDNAKCLVGETCEEELQGGAH